MAGKTQITATAKAGFSCYLIVLRDAMLCVLHIDSLIFLFVVYN